MTETNPHKRTIKSFVIREGRMTTRQKEALVQHWDMYGLDIANGFQDFETLFLNKGPVVLEIGFGMGQSLFEMARDNPEINYIGVEVHRPGVGALLKLANESGLTNLKVYAEDAIEVLKKAIPDASLIGLQLFFPDPWHKKRHHKRRIVQPAFIDLVRSKLVQGGFFHLATDWENYAEHMLEMMQAASGFENKYQDYAPRPDSRPLTKFEQRGHRLGHGVWDLIFSKIL